MVKQASSVQALEADGRQIDKHPPVEQSLSTVSAVCFSLYKQLVAVPFSDLVELLEVPVCTRLPKVQSWVRGVANLRGRLLPIIDLAEFVGTSLTTAPEQQRVLVMEIHGNLAGLQIDEVLGVRHFAVDSFVDELESSGAIAPYLDGGYRDGDKVWGLFRLARLADDVRFLNVAAH